METKALSRKWIANLSILLIITFFCFLSVDLANAEAGDPSLRVSTSVTPSEIEIGSSGELKVTVSEVSGEDWAMAVTVTPLHSSFSSDGCTFSPSSKSIPRIDKFSSTTFYFTIHVSKDATLGKRLVTTRVKYYDTGLLDMGTYGPFYSSSNTEILVKKGRGSLSIVSSPSGAKVYIDGEYKGKTPVSLNKVIEGAHTIKLEKTGYNNITKTISVSAGRTSSVSETLTLKTGSISVSSAPSGANIYLDGTYKGTTPKTISGVTPGLHTIKLKKTGYNDITKAVSVSATRTVSVSETLISKIGSISVSSTPSGAKIYLDGTYKGTTPKTLRSVPIGTHTIKIGKERYNDETKSVSVKQDQTASVSVHLTLQTGSINIVGPDGASVCLDDVYKGTAPTTISNIPVGTYKITVEKFGYTTWRQTVNVLSMRAVTVTPDMVFLPMVTYNGVPLGAIAIICIALILLAFVWLSKGRKRKKSAQLTTSARKSKSEPKTSTSAPPSPPEPTPTPEPTPAPTPPPSAPIPPSDFTPRPTTPSTFPPELAHLYSDPVYAGKGGFARVFKAKRNTDNKIVAIKIPISLDEGTGRSFLREITSWQRLSHENIITLYDVNILPIPYLEMEYADSGSLDQMNKPTSVESASEIILGIADGLAYSHAQGVIHRDLKPMNVLLTKDLTPKISDWGLSKIVAESKTSSVYGFTPLYASPEQVSPKKFGKPDERTDVYQLGVIFYELLAGRPPFEGDDLVEVSTAIATEEPEPPSELNPEAEVIDPIILKCLAKKKEDRYQNIIELRNDIASALKTQLKESLRMSVSEQNMKRSAFYCAEICLVHARLGEIDEVMTYLKDMQNYASEKIRSDVDELLEELERRKGMSSEEKISEEFVGRLKSLLHQVRMGR